MATTDDTVAPAEVAGDAPAEETVKSKIKKKAAATRKPRNPPTHPPYIEMINEAITTLKERNGSSQYAIQKFIEEKHKQLPSNFRKLLLSNLKKFVASGKLVKVKGSYKLPSKSDSAPVKKTIVKAKAKAAPVKGKSGAAKPKAKPNSGSTKPKSKSKSKPKSDARGGTKSTATTKPVVTKVVGTKRKAVADTKTKAKVAKTSAKATPKKVGAKKAGSGKKGGKSVKAKSVKSPAKRVVPKRGKK